MRLFRILSLLLVVVAPSAFADSPYLVEMILVRQNAEPVINSRAAPENWDAGAPRLPADKISPPRLGNIVDKLSADTGYTVLLHRAWDQNLGEQPDQPVRRQRQRHRQRTLEPARRAHQEQPAQLPGRRPLGPADQDHLADRQTTQRTTARRSGLIQRHAPDIVTDQTPGPFVGQSL